MTNIYKCTFSSPKIDQTSLYPKKLLFWHENGYFNHSILV